MLPLSIKSAMTLVTAISIANSHALPVYAKNTSDGIIPTNIATAFAIMYEYPLTQYALLIDPIISSVGTNAIVNQNDAATASEGNTNRPNVDTLYSQIAIDLSRANVAITIPEVPDGRFYVFPFYDLWGNNFVNLGSLQDTIPGKYLLRPAESSNSGFEAATEASNYVGFINYPTTYGTILPRILLLNHSSDLDAVHGIQAQIIVEEVPCSGYESLPQLTANILGNGTLKPMALVSPASLDDSSIQMLLEVLARLAFFNLPIDPDYVPAMVTNFKAAGLSDGQYSPPHDVNYTLANQLVTLDLAASQRYLESYGNDWVDYIAEYSGNFHDEYAIRSLIAFSAYLELMHSEAIYPEWVGDGLSGLSLTASESYIITFPSGKPPVDGFWSITIYNSQNALIPNSLNVWSLGDRSNLTYPDGTLVYDGSSRKNPFSILIQPSDLAPPANWTSNWLPAPPGGGNFSVNIRVYGPEEPLTAGGSYIFPVVTKQAAIVA